MLRWSVRARPVSCIFERVSEMALFPRTPCIQVADALAWFSSVWDGATIANRQLLQPARTLYLALYSLSPCTVPAERQFSHMGDTLTERRQRLTPEHADDLLTLKNYCLFLRSPQGGGLSQSAVRERIARLVEAAEVKAEPPTSGRAPAAVAVGSAAV